MNVKVKDLPYVKIPDVEELDISFEVEEDDLQGDAGKRVLVFFKRLNDKGIKVNIKKSLPRCIFDSKLISSLKTHKIPLECKDCKKLYTVEEEGMLKSCDIINKRGPKLEYMKDDNQIWEYFSTFHNEMEPCAICKNCLFFRRKKCNALCFRK